MYPPAAMCTSQKLHVSTITSNTTTTTEIHRQCHLSASAQDTRMKTRTCVHVCPLYLHSSDTASGNAQAHVFVTTGPPGAEQQPGQMCAEHCKHVLVYLKIRPATQCGTMNNLS
eukprot:1157389-Pelagomonas_calceolata.AAC.8